MGIYFKQTDYMYGTARLNITIVCYILTIQFLATSCALLIYICVVTSYTEENAYNLLQ